MFELDEFIAQCRQALADPTPQLAVKELVARAMARPDAVHAALGPATMAEIGTLHHAPDLTILRVVWAPGMSIYPHDHRMWAVIGLYAGQENNTFFRRSPSGLVSAGGLELECGQATLLGQDVIHAVTNPLRAYTEAIHIYGGDFFAMSRSEWDETTLEEQPYNVDHARRAFADANARWLAESAATR